MVTTLLPAPQTKALSQTLAAAWAHAGLEPSKLGVPAVHTSTACFFDLWGCVLSARDIADYTTAHLPGAFAEVGITAPGISLATEDVIAYPTLAAQEALLAARLLDGDKHSSRAKRTSINMA